MWCPHEFKVHPVTAEFVITVLITSSQFVAFSLRRIQMAFCLVVAHLQIDDLNSCHSSLQLVKSGLWLLLPLNNLRHSCCCCCCLPPSLFWYSLIIPVTRLVSLDLTFPLPLAAGSVRSCQRGEVQCEELPVTVALVLFSPSILNCSISIFILNLPHIEMHPNFALPWHLPAVFFFFFLCHAEWSTHPWSGPLFLKKCGLVQESNQGRGDQRSSREMSGALSPLTYLNSTNLWAAQPGKVGHWSYYAVTWTMHTEDCAFANLPGSNSGQLSRVRLSSEPCLLCYYCPL